MVIAADCFFQHILFTEIHLVSTMPCVSGCYDLDTSTSIGTLGKLDGAGIVLSAIYSSTVKDYYVMYLEKYGKIKTSLFLSDSWKTPSVGNDRK